MVESKCSYDSLHVYTVTNNTALMLSRQRQNLQFQLMHLQQMLNSSACGHLVGVKKKDTSLTHFYVVRSFHQTTLVNMSLHVA